ncbi:NAD(P)H-dependent oxidoreductase [Arenibaculum pallidiluteum]|uniref:NAD(P)H-dependent oxidoreductase n=1 Tax=Arenibaculum pallidiluteum TaxID=2812559 RepID=UPI001A960569|nr:NAD(P)H-dependent oxidoreductase [Arenibaculum pallidiluteum]
MRLQVVHAHPLRDSFNHAAFRTVVDTAHAAGHTVVETDLYAMAFDPALGAEERASYYAPPYDDTRVRGLVEELRRAEGLIFVFPTWWFGMPAMMKGYFDRVWGPGIAFDPDPEGGRIRPLLTHVRLFGVVTSYGSPWWLTKLVGDPGRKQIMRALKPMCGSRTRTFWLALHDMDRATARDREAFLGRLRRRIGKIR